MTVKAPSPPALRQDAERNRRLLLDTARRVFAEHGVDVGVDAIAAAAGVGTGTLYRRFPSKQHLIEALVDDLAGQLLSTGQAALARRDGTGLWEFLRAAGAIQADNHGLLCRLWNSSRPAAQTQQIRAAIEGLVDDAHTHTTLDPAVTPHDIRYLLYGLRGVIEATAVDDPEAWRRYLEVLVAALSGGGFRR